MRERILLMGGPGSGKTHQLLKVVEAVEPKQVYVLDLEDKVGAFLDGVLPIHMHLEVAMDWEDIRKVVDQWKKEVPPESWVMVDRADLLWVSVQRWYTRAKYKEELADRMLKSAQAIKSSSFMIAPRFDMGSWQVINEAYEYVIMTLLYGLRSNVLLTAGVRGLSSEDSNPYELLGGINVAPRGQKELAHQPHSVFLLMRKKESREFHYLISTAKDLPGREVFDEEPLMDFSIQYPHF